MVTYISQVNSKYTFSQEVWCVSRVNTTGSILRGHAAIIVEGVDQAGKRFVKQFDIRAIIKEESIQDRLQGSIGNRQGYISEIREFDSYHFLPGSKPENWFARPLDVEAMMKSIRDQRDKLEAGEMFAFQLAGAWRSKYLGGNAAHNCFTWTEKKLAISKVGSGYRMGDSIKAVPDSRAQSCIIL